jgi:methylated-DNA-[protein]-cysteine S-methyltransferase
VRAAGTACGTNPLTLVVPCHRVLRSGGGLGGYGGGVEMKEALLRLEGVLDG